MNFYPSTVIAISNYIAENVPYLTICCNFKETTIL